MRKLVFLLGVILSVVNTQELNIFSEIEQYSKKDMKALEPITQVKEIDNNDHSKPLVKVGKNFAIKADAYMNEGYSEAELKMGNTQLNEIDAPISRYSAGVELNYSIKENSRVKLEIFASNALELNTQRVGGKVKAYDDGVRYEENVYNYGDKMMYSAWTNNIGIALTLFKNHRLILTFKQAQISNDELLVFNAFSLRIGSGSWKTIASSNASNINPWVVSTQAFLTYSYIF